MKVLVTGASGFIGSHIVRMLLSKGCEVAALIRPQTSLHRLRGEIERITTLEVDLGDRDAIRLALKQWSPDACIHLAWYAEPGLYLNSPLNVASLMSSLLLIEELVQSGCRQITAAGTCAEYDVEQGWLREEGPTKPETLYAATKLALCLTGQKMALSETNFTWARIFYPYGPWEDDRRAVPALICALLRGNTFAASAGTQIRDYLHVKDIASAFWLLTEARASGIYNIASGEPITMRRVMESVGEIIGHPELIQFNALPARNWDPQFICGNNQRLRALGWSPHYNFESGLSQTVDWWRTQLVQATGGNVL